MKKTIAVLVIGMALLAGSAAQAASLCSAGLQPNGARFGDVTFNGTSATDCYGIVEGAATAATLGFTDVAGFTGVSEVANTAPTGTGTGSLNGIDFTLSSTLKGALGNWTLDWAAAGITGPITLDLVVVLETANSFASYFFNDVTLTAATGTGTGGWVTNFIDPVTESIARANLVALFAGDVQLTSTPPSSAVAEPGMLTVLGLAAMALGLARRRRR